MAYLSLCGSVVFAAVAVGVRAWVHVRRTNRSPFRRGGVVAMFSLTVAFIAGPVVDLTTGIRRLAHGPVLATAGLALMVAGFAVTAWSQAAMGNSWRIGVDPGERNELVTNGPFRWVRNPIYTAMIGFVVGLALLVPNVVSIAATLLAIGALEWHVRTIEEPHLRAWPAYAGYAARVGRFVPRVGALPEG